MHTVEQFADGYGINSGIDTDHGITIIAPQTIPQPPYSTFPVVSGFICNTSLNVKVMVFRLAIYGVFLVDSSAGWLCASPGIAFLMY